MFCVFKGEIKMKRKAVAGLLILCLTSALAGCGKDTEASDSTDGTKTTPEVTEEPKKEEAEPTEEPEEEEQQIALPENQDLVTDYTSVEGITLEAGTHIALVGQNLSTGYWSAVKEGAQQAVADLNEKLEFTSKEDKIKLTFEGTDTDADVETQINTIDAVLAENPDVLCISAIDMDSCKAQIETARENGIPVVILDSGIVGENELSVCATDNTAVGAEAARHMSEAVGGNGKVLIASHQESTQTSVDRINGFRNELAASSPSVTADTVIYETKEKSITDQLMEALETSADLKGIFCTNEEITCTVLNALKDVENAPIVIGVDAGKEVQAAIENGTLYGTVCQNPYGMGYATIVMAGRAAAGLPNSQFVDSGFQWLDASNIDAVENQKYLYK